MRDLPRLEVADRIRRGAEPPPALVAIEDEQKRRGLPDIRDSAVIARSATATIWHTQKTACNDLPQWRPPFGPLDADGLYRGFHWEALETVLQTGLDVPAQSAFFASCYPDKAWEYPTGRALPAMLVLDGRQAARSFICKPTHAGADWTADTTLYPHRYFDGPNQVHTRFAVGRGTQWFLTEQMYGYWIPGDARAALIAVVIGGPHGSVMQLLDHVSEHVGLEFA